MYQWDDLLIPLSRKFPKYGKLTVNITVNTICNYQYFIHVVQGSSSFESNKYLLWLCITGEKSS